MRRKCGVGGLGEEVRLDGGIHDQFEIDFRF